MEICKKEGHCFIVLFRVYLVCYSISVVFIFSFMTIGAPRYRPMSDEERKAKALRIQKKSDEMLSAQVAREVMKGLRDEQDALALERETKELLGDADYVEVPHQVESPEHPDEVVSTDGWFQEAPDSYEGSFVPHSKPETRALVRPPEADKTLPGDAQKIEKLRAHIAGVDSADATLEVPPGSTYPKTADTPPAAPPASDRDRTIPFPTFGVEDSLFDS